MHLPRTLHTAAAVADARAVRAAPGAVLLEWGHENQPPHAAHVLAVGSPEEVIAHPGAADATRIDQPDSILLPAFANAHTHLDLSAAGPIAYDPRNGFQSWLANVLKFRAHNDVRASTTLGARLALEGGVVAVGDICGDATALHALRESDLLGVGFLEFFGLADATPQSLARARQAIETEHDPDARIRLGLQPHAPYSVSVSLYEGLCDLAGEHEIPLATHLAESRLEHDLITTGRGELQSLLAGMGMWSDAVAAEFAADRSPIARLAPVLRRAPWLLAHVIGADEEDLAILAQTGCSVAYCPRGAAYFGHEQTVGPHRYREMLAAGVNVALGTDSVINLPPRQGGGPSPLSVLDEMRFLRARDHTDPLLLLAMGTTNAAAALGLDQRLFLLEPGPVAGVTSVRTGTLGEHDSPLDAALHTTAPARLLTAPGRR